MDKRASSTSLLVLISILLALADPVAAGMKATFAAGVGVAADTAVLRHLMTTRLEDGVAPELTVDVELHRRVLAGGFVKSNVLNPDKAACIKSCPARGRPYTGRGCSNIYQCPH
ncbi:hypothetical protein Zm00014a_015840 [Zea mays]|jgi:hypothetical protein|uniref:Uncharacterized protein n=2 Tax=Zea mays TaxID=4577 RepID=B6TP23_MAIZE|nr:uncharacterized protein LOC100277095 precursor [Zea mays]ACG38856.1 hypothetical protein [Zea mays]ACR36607.1 unknown [Zea mays]ONM18665.1 hypothetical protein ZEAMMB73_Zm00001d004232 [Zea mays]ONM18666.1 hypothetical protein ZEAMMB73_Zm00001d004232 [Zea mays]PWZ39164.1 hypothetical protein Zm00014a_015840 [Zea mays]|eukprot:NP_001144230.1 uncharacterized protein LOC100277095 precursor [Zea mays]